MAPSTLPRPTAPSDGVDLTIVDMGWMNKSLREPGRDADAVAQPCVAPCTWPAPSLVEDERTRLEAGIAAAEERIAAAKARAAVRDSELRALLRAEFVAARGALADMQRQHDETIAAIRAAAQIDVDRILTRARQLAAGHHERAINAERPRAHDAS